MNKEQREQLYAALKQAAEVIAELVQKVAKAVQVLVERLAEHGINTWEKIQEVSRYYELIDECPEKRRSFVRSSSQFQRTAHIKYKEQMKRFHNYEKPWKAWKGQRR